jgi:UDP-N-acetyl-D-galactosamine dehydrogenase
MMMSLSLNPPFTQELPEEKCIPVLERCSGLVVTKGLNIGYSPERINPGDRNRKLVDIPKVTSGSDVKSA